MQQDTLSEAVVSLRRICGHVRDMVDLWNKFQTRKLCPRNQPCHQPNHVTNVTTVLHANTASDRVSRLCMHWHMHYDMILS